MASARLGNRRRGTGPHVQKPHSAINATASWGLMIGPVINACHPTVSFILSAPSSPVDESCCLLHARYYGNDRFRFCTSIGNVGSKRAILHSIVLPSLVPCKQVDVIYQLSCPPGSLETKMWEKSVSSNVSVDVDSAQRSVHEVAETWKTPTQAWTKISNRLCLKRRSATEGSLMTHKLPAHSDA